MRTLVGLAALLGVSFLALTRTGAAEEPRTVSIASVSVIPVKWDKQANSQKLERLIRDAAGKGARLVITPEGALEGYVVNEVIREQDAERKAQLTKRFQQLAEPSDGPYVARFRQLADELDIHLILGFLEADGDRTFNTAVLLGPDGRIVGKYRKTHFHQGYKVNPPGYTPGDTYPVFDLGFMKVGIMICFDRQLPEPARMLALGGADLDRLPGLWWLGRLEHARDARPGLREPNVASCSRTHNRA